MDSHFARHRCPSHRSMSLIFCETPRRVEGSRMEARHMLTARRCFSSPEINLAFAMDSREALEQLLSFMDC